MGWHKGGWYTARWVDRLLFPANWPSATRLIPELQNIEVGSFIPDGAPETKCGFIVEQLDPVRTLVLHSTSHLPASWREKGRAQLDWSWTFILTPVDGGRGTRFLFRSRWITAPWWFTRQRVNADPAGGHRTESQPAIERFWGFAAAVNEPTAIGRHHDRAVTTDRS